MKLIRILQEKYHAVSPATLFAMHIALCGIGVIHVYTSLLTLLEKNYQSNVVRVAREQARFLDWSYVFPAHKYTIVAYIISAAALLALFIVVCLVLTDDKKQKSIAAEVFPWVYIIDALFIFQSLFFKIAGIGSSTTVLFSWMIIVLIPFFGIPKKNEGEGTQSVISRLPKSLAVKMLFIAVCTEFLFLFIPLATGKFFIFNEYFDIPSQTYIHGSDSEPLRAVDSIQYINQERLWGNQLHYDLRTDNGQDPKCLPGNVIDIKRNKEIESLVETENHRLYFQYPSDKLCILGTMNDELFARIKSALPKSEWRKVDDAYTLNKKFYAEIDKKAVNPEHVDFFNKNAFEFVETMHDSELTFYHHFQFLKPVHDLALGRPLHENVVLYGNNFLVVKAILGLLGGVTYESLLHVIFSSYIIYYIFFLAVTFFILRDLRYVTAVLLFAVGSINGLGFHTLFTGLGYSPVRHILDIIVLLSCYQYLSTGRFRWLLSAMIIAGAGIFLDSYVGSFVAIALLGVLCIRLLLGHASNKPRELAALAVGGVVYACIFIFGGGLTAKSTLSAAVMEGVMGFSISRTHMFLVLIGFIAMYALLVYAFTAQYKNITYFVLLLVFYVQLYIIYWLTIHNYGHLYVIVPFIAFAAMAGIKFIVAPALSLKFNKLLMALILSAGAIYFASACFKMWTTRYEYNQIARNHVVYEWNFPAMHVQSSMDPRYFAHAVDVINKYAHGEKGVHILSKYNTLLLFLSDKYSLLPPMEWSPYLNNYEEFDRSLAKIERHQPEILFVDSDIKRNQLTAKMTPNPAWPLMPQTLSRMDEKVKRLSSLKKLFEKIEARYEKVEQTELLSVYRKK
jgi:hypothetical protein